MARYKEGINNYNSTNAINFNNSPNPFLNVLPKIVRVKDIVLDDNHPKFKEVGGWNGIGVIFFEDILTRSSNPDFFAYPINPQIKCYPLVNEIVFLQNQSLKFVNAEKTNKLDYFYFPSTNVWNHPHHNAYPDMMEYGKLNQDQKNDYDFSGENSVRRVEDEDTNINLNYTLYPNPSQDIFEERLNIHPILSFSGDTIYEGRYGQSLRFGNTANSLLSTPPNSLKSTVQNNWSNSGKNGDPITILRNGQPSKASNEGWIPITEDINKDLSSIYLTSTQKIPFSLANENFYSYNPSNYLPAKPAIYKDPQIILNSNRIVLNANSDSILISGESSVGLSSNSSINIEAKQIYLDGVDIKLGSKIATEPVLKGNITVEYLKMIVTEISNLATALKSNQIWPGGSPSPDSAMMSVATTAESNLERISSQLDSLKSNFVKTS